jgi:hypothetical protein
MDKQIAMLESYCDFSDPSAVYILILLPRKKENLDQTEREKLQKRSRYIVSNMEDVKFALDEFNRYVSLYPELIFRIYVSVNRRSLDKGLDNYKARIGKIETDLRHGNDQAWTSVAKLGSEFKSVLAQKESKHDNYWFFDVDLRNDLASDIEKVAQFEAHLKQITKLHYFGLSKSGYAIVTRGMNPDLLEMPEGVELKKDAYLYVDVLNDK